MLIGAHVSSRGGIARAVDNGLAIGAEVIQTHPTSAQQWRPMRMDDTILTAFHDAYGSSGLHGHFLHAIYLINLATPKAEHFEQSLASLAHYMDIADRLGADGVVFHPGSHLGAGFDAMLPQMHSGLRRILDTSTSKARLLVENSAGSGGCVGCSFAEVGRIVAPINDPRIGVCLDTQHLFASGYDFRTPETAAETLAAFDREIGFERLALVHANDSRTPLASNVDRHANIGEGEIGLQAFEYVLAEPRLRCVPWLLEVPGQDRSGPTAAQIDLLRACADAAVREPHLQAAS